jgi:hypothetical protein
MALKTSVDSAVLCNQRHKYDQGHSGNHPEIPTTTQQECARTQQCADQECDQARPYVTVAAPAQLRTPGFHPADLAFESGNPLLFVRHV